MDKEERQFRSEEPDEQHTEEQGSYRERAEEELEKKPLAEDAGPVGEGRDREATDQEEEPRQASADHVEGRQEEDKGLLEKLKDKLKGE